MRPLQYWIICLTLCASPALAAGINLSYNDCGTFGTETRTFACDTNAGTNVMVGSFVAPTGVDQYDGCESELEIQTDSVKLPDWWKFRTVGACRQTSLMLSGDFTSGPFHCDDFFAGSASYGITAYDIGYGGPSRSRIKLFLFVPDQNRAALTYGVEYYAYKLSFNNEKSVGACAGCAIRACINARYIMLHQYWTPGGNVMLTNPANRAHVRWQSASDASCIGATPARNSTWGAVKSLYR